MRIADAVTASAGRTALKLPNALLGDANLAIGMGQPVILVALRSAILVGALLFLVGHPSAFDIAKRSGTSNIEGLLRQQGLVGFIKRLVRVVQVRRITAV